MFRDVPECSGMFRDVPCSGFYRRPKPFPKILYWRLRLHACPRTLERTNPRVSCKFMKVLGICYHYTFYVLFLRCIWTLAALIHLFSSSGRLKSTCLCATVSWGRHIEAVRKATSSPGLFPQKLREKPWGRGCAKGVFECPPFNDKQLWIVCGIYVYQLYDVFKSQIFKNTVVTWLDSHVLLVQEGL